MKGTKHIFKLPKLIATGMVLQRQAKTGIWGWDIPGQVVTIQFIDKTYETVVDGDGKWYIELDKLAAGGPYIMLIKGSKQAVLKDILVGDVWICSGQSNMELTMNWVKDLYADEIHNCTNTYIRQFLVPEEYNFIKSNEDFTEGEWLGASPTNILKYSAVAYFFAKKLYEQYNVPIGLINASVPGSPAEAWISEETLSKYPHYTKTLQQFKDEEYIKRIKKDDEQREYEWFKELDEKDILLTSEKKPWFLENQTYHNIMTLPNTWEENGIENFSGSIWIWKEVELPKKAEGKEAHLHLGAITEKDTTYINGVLVGETDNMHPLRKYSIPKNVLKEGNNVIAIRVVSTSGKGAFVKEKEYHLVVENKIFPLNGEWKYQIGAKMEPLPKGTSLHYQPAGLYNSMIAPIKKYTIKGIIWYQGESNADRAQEYERLFPDLIWNWRNDWGQGDLPFLYVQLANYLTQKQEPFESNWAKLRWAQLKTTQVPNTGMVVTTDIGEWNDLHPVNKKDVGYRLALAAQKIAYGEDIVYSGPVYQSMQRTGSIIEISFDHIGSGLITREGKELQGFAISDDNDNFVCAKARIIDNKVHVWSDKIQTPVAVRYAWKDNPQEANLYNKEGLPASSFTTKD